MSYDTLFLAIDGSGESFLFKFDTTSSNLHHYPWTGENDFFVWCGHDQIAMGGGGDGFGFVLDTDFVSGASFACTTFGNSVLVNNHGDNNGNFRIKNVECWGFEGIFGKVSTKFTKKSARVKIT